MGIGKVRSRDKRILGTGKVRGKGVSGVKKVREDRKVKLVISLVFRGYSEVP